MLPAKWNSVALDFLNFHIDSVIITLIYGESAYLMPFPCWSVESLLALLYTKLGDLTNVEIICFNACLENILNGIIDRFLKCECAKHISSH